MEPEVNQEVQPEAQPGTPPAVTKKPFPTKLVTTLGVILVLAVAGGVYAMKRPKKAAVTTTTSTATPSATASQSITTASLTKLADLGLYYTPPQDPALTPVNNTATYYSAGTFTEGTYAGYKRIVSIYQQDGPIPPASDIFATKDDTTYYLVSTVVTKDFLDNNQYYNTARVKGIITIASGMPDSLTVGNGYLIYVDQPAIDSLSNATPSTSISFKFLTDLTNYTKLTEVNGLTLYADNTSTTAYVDPSATPASFLTYRAGSSRILAIDKTGVAYYYNLSTPADYAKYLAQKKLYDADEAKRLKDSAYTTTVDYPQQKGIVISTAGFSSPDSFYGSYSNIKDSACSTSVNTWVTKDIAATDLKQVGTVNGLTVYALKDVNSPVLSKLYDYDITTRDFGTDQSNYVDANGKALATPTRAEYVAKNPLLFVKDPWGRYEAVKENYYFVNYGGCGKPVVYLYPEKPTTVSVQFAGSMNLTTDIPTYNHGWKVLAQPNGQLTDLQPSATDCAAFATPSFGSEYAVQACASKQYPYLYWAGSGSNAAYPVHTDGWVVAKADLSSFLNATLDAVGLSAQEKSDMLSYWLPELQQKNAPYYKLDFLQTAEMNQIAPMRVTPAPNTTFRIFLDWAPLTAKPATLPMPQTLQKLVRNGFTLVEWGGLKR